MHGTVMIPGSLLAEPPFSNPSNAIEHWCDDVATEIAVPATDLHNNFNPHVNLTLELDRLSHRYHCPTSIILRKLRATGLITFHKTNNIKDDKSLFSYWENPSTTTGGKSERTCYLACLSLLTETSHDWGH